MSEASAGRGGCAIGREGPTSGELATRLQEGEGGGGGWRDRGGIVEVRLLLLLLLPLHNFTHFCFRDVGEDPICQLALKSGALKSSGRRVGGKEEAQSSSSSSSL